MTTALYEFFSRGILWGRVLLLGFMMPVHEYGLLLTYLGIDGLIAATISYPSIKEVLVGHDVRPIVYRRYGFFFILAAVPAFLAITFYAKISPVVAVVLLASAFLNGASQIALYVLRVVDVAAHNRAKTIWSVITSVLFLALLPRHWAWLPAVYLVGAVWIISASQKAVRAGEVVAAQEADFLHLLRGWLIYGTQALMLSMPQHGIRLIVAATMTMADVARFTQFYMLATASFFLHSAVMIPVEAELSRAVRPELLRGRFRRAAIVSGILISITLAHFAILMLIDATGVIKALLNMSLKEEPALLAGLIAFSALSGLRTVVNALALAASGRSFSLLATSFGMLGLGVGLIGLTPTFSLAGVGLALTLGQIFELAVLILFVLSASRRGRQVGWREVDG